jgi:mannose-6-phosphate isomerase-like protein (cupin superfamily)
MTDAATQQDEGLGFSLEPGRMVTLKLLGHQTGDSLMLFEEATPPGTATPLHVHHQSDEVMYVLAGAFVCKVDDVTAVAPGGCAFIPRGAPHAWRNVGSEPGRVLFAYAPAKAGTAGTLFEVLAKHGGTPPVDGTEIMDWLRQYDAEIVGPEPF